MKITAHFSLSEFNSKDGAVMPQQVKKNVTALAQNLQVLRNHLNLPVIITSGYRSPAYNKRVGGVANSQHLLGTAADIQVKGLSPKAVAKAIESLIASGKMQQGGIGVYATFTHYDIRGTKARW